jgi:hypothetical protein
MDELESMLDQLAEQLKICDNMLKELSRKLDEVRTNIRPTKRARYCRGCDEDQPNQLAHYGGCIPDCGLEF